MLRDRGRCAHDHLCKFRLHEKRQGFSVKSNKKQAKSSPNGVRSRSRPSEKVLEVLQAPISSVFDIKFSPRVVVYFSRQKQQNGVEDE